MGPGGPKSLKMLKSDLCREHAALSPNDIEEMELIRECFTIASDPKHSRWFCPLLLLSDTALCMLVVWKIPCKYRDLQSSSV